MTDKLIFGTEIDKTALRAAADEYLNASAIYLAAKALAKFNFNDLAASWRNVVSLVNAVIAGVELAKAKFEGVPGKAAAAVAVDILDDAITFTGPAGRLVELVDGPVLKLLVNVVLGDRHGKNWLDLAWVILGIAKPE